MGIGRKNLLRALHRLDVKSIEIKNCDVRDKFVLYGLDLDLKAHAKWAQARTKARLPKDCDGRIGCARIAVPRSSRKLPFPFTVATWVDPTYRVAAFPVFVCRFLPSFGRVRDLPETAARW